MYQFKSAFIQGASRGLGLEIVRNLLHNCPELRIIASSRNATKSSLKELSLEFSGKLNILDIDLQDERSLFKGVKNINSITNSLDLIINAAGFLHDDNFMPEKKLNQLDLTYLKKSFEINVFGPMYLTSQLIKLFDKDACRIVNISARVGSIHDNKSGGWYSYRASKAAQNMFTKNMALEFERKKNVVCVALHPGTLDTELSKPFIHGEIKNDAFSPKASAEKLLKIISNLDKSDSGSFLDWNGKGIHW